jgi:hypothetical protein
MQGTVTNLATIYHKADENEDDHVTAPGAGGAGSYRCVFDKT